VTDLTCFKAYDIRGEIGFNMDEDMAYQIGRATAQHLKAKTVVIGFDARETSPTFAAAAARGVMGRSVRVFRRRKKKV
jgi:phosphomannomutase